jgi:hypothetical protein
MTKFQQFVANAEVAVCILGNPESGDFALCDLGPHAEDLQRDLVQRGYRFVGLLGMVQGVPRSALAEPLEANAIDALAEAFLKRWLYGGGRPEAGDSVRFLEGLYRLPDTRD